MKQYLVKLIFNINIDKGNLNSQFDEQIRMIEASSEVDAFYKARNIGKKEEEHFTNADHQLVHWQFIDVADIYTLEDFKDGDQVYSNTRKIKDSTSFVNYIRQKSIEIQAKSLTFA